MLQLAHNALVRKAAPAEQHSPNAPCSSWWLQGSCAGLLQDRARQQSVAHM